ncbi:unnamed protein product [Prorocentrum cordatum]|uniref:Uncharacterized protein n=1 Tax=Prorocentrum cordatum TaxID=2364126 RepID=A0ABN9WHS1_9DINO|nr:unnamed protein product [Polarella glacialis]
MIRSLHRQRWAELWMGTHPNGPSTVVLPGECQQPQLERVTTIGEASRPLQYQAGGALPFGGGPEIMRNAFLNHFSKRIHTIGWVKTMLVGTTRDAWWRICAAGFVDSSAPKQEAGREAAQGVPPALSRRESQARDCSTSWPLRGALWFSTTT